MGPPTLLDDPALVLRERAERRESLDRMALLLDALQTLESLDQLAVSRHRARKPVPRRGAGLRGVAPPLEPFFWNNKILQYVAAIS